MSVQAGCVNYGFTGTKDGLTPAQQKALTEMCTHIAAMQVLRTPVIVHHGDCIGADAAFHQIMSTLGTKVVVHPPDNPYARSFCRGDLFHPEKPYLTRNQDIVDSSDYLIACPKSLKESVRSGTWYTVRYARKKNIRIFFIFPDGTVHVEYEQDVRPRGRTPLV